MRLITIIMFIYFRSKPAYMAYNNYMQAWVCKKSVCVCVYTLTYTYTYTLGVTSHIYAHLKYQLFLTINRLTALVSLCSGCRALVRRTILVILILKALALFFQIDEDSNLVPEAIQGGTYSFNSSTNVPTEGFQF